MLDISTVQFAILETDGTLSVFPYPKEMPAPAAAAGIRVPPQYLSVTIIEDGFLSLENLRRAGRDEKWLQRVLAQYRTDREGTFLLSVDENGKTLWIGKEGKR